MPMTEDAKARRKGALQQKRARENLLLSIAAGQGLQPLKILLDDAHASILEKEAGVEAAIVAGTLAKSDVTGILIRPIVEEYGLDDENYEPKVISWFKRLAFKSDGNERFSRFSLVAIWLLSSAIYWKRGEDILPALIMGVGTFPVLMLVVVGICFGISHIIVSNDHKSLALKRFKADYLRFDVASQARLVIVRANAASSLYDSTGPEFEIRTSRVFRKWGYQVIRMGGANDGGVDLVVKRGQEHALVQCKAYAKVVGPAIVRELYGTLTHSDANYAYLVTLHGASSSAIEWIRGKPISILTATDLTLDAMPTRAAAQAERYVK